MDNSAIPFLPRLARSATIAVTTVLLMLALGASGNHAQAAVPGTSGAYETTKNTTPQKTAQQFHATAAGFENSGKTPGSNTDGNGTGSEEKHQFLSPGLLGLTALVTATALVGSYLTIRSRRRPPYRQETE